MGSRLGWPTDWSLRPLQDLVRKDCPICYGILQPGPHVDNGVPVVAIRDLDEWHDDMRRVSTEIDDAYFRSRIAPNDLLISVKGTTGRVGIVPPNFKGNISRDIARIRLNSDQVPEFWFHMLQSFAVQQALGITVVGTTRRELSIGRLRKILVPCPPKHEQAALSSALSDIHKLMKSLDNLVAKKQTIKLATMQQLLTGKTRLSGFVSPWREKTLADIGHCFAGGTPSTMREDYWGGQIVWLPSGRVQNNILSSPLATEETITEKGLAESAAKIIHPDSVLVAITGATCANVAFLRFQAAANQSVVAIEPFDQENGRFLFYLLRLMRRDILALKGGSAQAGVNLATLKNLRITLPEPEEQLAVVSVLSDIDSEIALLEKRLEKISALRQGMMQVLLTAKIRLVKPEVNA